MNSRILVVEDDNVLAHHLKLCLKIMGHTVVDVCSFGEDAVDRAKELLPDLILMDIKLRGQMNGIAAMHEIHEHLDTPVVYLTGCEDDITLQSTKNTDPFGYLLKPFRDSELRIVIEIALYRHRMEKKVRERELSYQVLVESLQGIVCRVFVDDGELVFFNDRLEKMTGYRAEELPENDLDSLVLPGDAGVLRSIIAPDFVEDKPYEAEYRIRHKDGRIRFFLERGRAIKRKGGERSFIDRFIVDITERKAAEGQLQLAYRKLMERQGFIESILTNIQSGIVVTDLDFCILLMNPSAEKFLNASGESASGRYLSEVCPTFARALKSGSQDTEIHCSECSREHVIGFKIFDMKDRDGVVNGHIISFADVTEIIKIRSEMKQKDRLANLGEFVARVAHEIRNPLFGMTAICQIFSMELQLNDDHKKLMEIMMKESLRLKQNVEELLDCSRELKIVRKRCDLTKIVDDTLFENRLFIDEKNIAIEKDIPNSDFTVEADEDKIKQVLINLLKNAVEASPENTMIRISVGKDQENIHFRISDSGTGIPGNIIDKIFDIFYTTKRHGTGLGLAISKNIAVAHGGSLQARNNDEGGATFVFTLPV